MCFLKQTGYLHINLVPKLAETVAHPLAILSLVWLRNDQYSLANSLCFFNNLYTLRQNMW